jgi:hypothetical protein
MGKDREGKFHPRKGKPSGSGKEDSAKLDTPVVGSIEQYIDLADKYTEGPDEMPANVKIRHPNRNVNKGEEKKSEKPVNKSSYKSKNDTFGDDQIKVNAEELPGILTKELFTDLASFTSEHSISVYMPTHTAGVEVNENADNISFKTALQNVAAQLKQRGLDQAGIQKILEPGYELLRNDTFWKNLTRGLAVFMSQGFFKYVKMPDSPREEHMINSTFMLKPLVNAMTVKEYFYLLVISKKQAKFFKADAFGISQIDVPELPNGVTDVVHFEEKEDQKLFRSESGQAGKGAAFHGHGAGRPDEKEHLAIYLEEVDKTLWEEVLNRENVPLLLAGVEYLLPIFRSVSHYNNIWPEVLKGSHEHDDLNSLYQQARTIMEPYFRERTKKALEMYGNQSATALTSSIPADVIPAAHYSRIWHLFVRKDEHLWGTFNEMENVLELHDEKQEGDECLVDKAVIKTILNGGDVHFISREDMPADSPVAALMRY